MREWSLRGGGGKKAGRVKCASESGEGDVSLPD